MFTLKIIQGFDADGSLGNVDMYVEIVEEIQMLWR
jgi:hypothetical protein